MDGYTIKIDRHAFDRIRHRMDDAPQVVWDELKAHLRRFAQSPASLSRKAPIPFYVGHQMFECFIPVGRELYQFRIYFKYSQDEETILIEHVGLAISESKE
jgi:hypothetical protein